MSILKACVAAMAFGLVPLTAGIASADRVVVEAPGPEYVPHADFRFEEGGVYRDHGGHYWHYHQDRGWHRGRYHDEHHHR